MTKAARLVARSALKFASARASLATVGNFWMLTTMIFLPFSSAFLSSLNVSASTTAPRVALTRSASSPKFPRSSVRSVRQMVTSNNGADPEEAGSIMSAKSWAIQTMRLVLPSPVEPCRRME